MNESRCGTCTLCCKVTAVFEIGKPVNTWCHHCKIGEGCAIYNDRPLSCRTFECTWYANENLPDELRPDRCKVVFESVSDGIVLALVDPDYPLAWKNLAVGRFIIHLVKKQNIAVVVSLGRGKPEAMFLPVGITAQQVYEGMVERAKILVEQRI